MAYTKKSQTGSSTTSTLMMLMLGAVTVLLFCIDSAMLRSIADFSNELGTYALDIAAVVTVAIAGFLSTSSLKKKAPKVGTKPARVKESAPQSAQTQEARHRESEKARDPASRMAPRQLGPTANHTRFSEA